MRELWLCQGEVYVQSNRIQTPTFIFVLTASDHLQAIVKESKSHAAS